MCCTVKNTAEHKSVNKNFVFHTFSVKSTNYKIIFRCCNRHFVDRISSKRFELCNIRHYSRVHVRTACIIDTVQDGEQQYEKLSSHVLNVLHMLIALPRRVFHKESCCAFEHSKGTSACIISSIGCKHK